MPDRRFRSLLVGVFKGRDLAVALPKLDIVAVYKLLTGMALA
jgi:hypothetical protein